MPFAVIRKHFYHVFIRHSPDSHVVFYKIAIPAGICRARQVHLSRLGKSYPAPQRPGCYSLQWIIRGVFSPKGSFFKVYKRARISRFEKGRRNCQLDMSSYFKMQRVIAPNGQVIFCVLSGTSRVPQSSLILK